MSLMPPPIRDEAATVPAAAYRAFTARRRETDRLRRLRLAEPLPGGRVRVGERTLINFSSNDYLGLKGHPELIRRAQEWAGRWGTGAGASRLVCGHWEPFATVEAKLAAGKGSEAALIFNSGFQANGSILASLLDRQVLGREPLVFSDRLNHASIHHGCRAAGARQIRYRHNDLDHLESLLIKHQGDPAPRFILSETVFSMDGDRVDVGGLVALKHRYGAFLYLDEAHATGVLGPNGFGLSAACPGEIDLAMGTFSKGLGSFGAYAACSQALVDYLINHCGGFIFATALPPPVLGAMDAALDLLPSFGEERGRLLGQADRLRQAFRAAGLDVGLSDTQIIPVMTGPEETALAASRLLEEAGLMAIAIRPPTVPPGGSRLRFSLSAAHGDADISGLVDLIPALANLIVGVSRETVGVSREAFGVSRET